MKDSRTEMNRKAAEESELVSRQRNVGGEAEGEGGEWSKNMEMSEELNRRIIGSKRRFEGKISGEGSVEE